MNVYYENSDKTKRVDFRGGKYEIADTDIFRHELQYVSEDDRITEFKRGIQTYEIEANINNTGKENWKELYDKMNGIFHRDIILKRRGALYVNGSYINCYVYASEPKEIFEDWGFQTAVLKIVTDSKEWITEENRQFLPSYTPSVSGGMDFPFDLPFDFDESKTGFEQWNIEHYTSSHFKMTIYGPCENPRILINGYPRQVFTSLEPNEYLVIDSRDSTVIKHLANGTTVSVYNSRQFQPSIFEKIPSGLLSIDWIGEFGFDITLYLERSGPRW